ncbi:MAG: glycosyltransferase family 39 protein [Chloroflexota bacterium]
MILLALVILAAHLVLARLGWRQPHKRSQYLNRLLGALAIFSLTLWIGVWISKLFPANHLFRITLQGYYLRSGSLLFWLSFELLILLAGIKVFSSDFQPGDWRQSKRAWVAGIALFIACLLVAFLSARTGIGVTPDIAGWGGPAVPILVDQFLFAALVGIAASIPLTILVKRLHKPQSGFWLDLIIFVILWAAAFFIWSGQPVPRSYFITTGAPLNNRLYPHSDAMLYALISQSVQLGYGFLGGEVVPRPLYILLLAIFHAIAGQKYQDVILVQTLVLALFPAALYLLGKALHSRPLGILIAVLAIIREINAFAATSLEVSHSKLMMADLPTALAVVLFTWSVVHWLKKPSASWIDPLLAGGLLGITALLRTQALILLPVTWLFLAWIYRRQWKRFGIASATLLLGFLLVVSPWIYRNRVNTGVITFDHPKQAGMVTQRYRVEMEDYFPRLPGESDKAYKTRLESTLGSFILAHPTAVTRFITAHFINSEVASLNTLPQCFGYRPFQDTLQDCRSFWHPITGNTLVGSLALVADLALVIVGLVACWKNWKLVGLIPAVYHLVYNLSNALARNSARRYILPVDWVLYFYFSVGIIELLFWLARPLHSGQSPFSEISQAFRQGSPGPHNARPRLRTGILFTGLFFLIGLSLPLSEIIVPPRYPAYSQPELVQNILAMPLVQDLPLEPQALRAFTRGDSAIVIQGRAFYPHLSSSSQALNFTVIGPGGARDVSLAIDAATNLPNVLDVIVLGCSAADPDGREYIDALLVIVGDPPKNVLLRSQTDSLTCPLP